MVSHPENGSDSPIGSDRDRGRDRVPAGILQGCENSQPVEFRNLLPVSCLTPF